MTDKISEVLDLVPMDSYRPERTIEITPQNDVEYARNNIKDIIDKSTPALNELLDYAYNAQNDKVYTALSSLIKTMVDANKQLVELNKINQETKKLELTNEELKTRDPNQVKHVNQTLNINMTTGELLNLILNKRKENNE